MTPIVQEKNPLKSMKKTKTIDSPGKVLLNNLPSWL